MPLQFYVCKCFKGGLSVIITSHLAAITIVTWSNIVPLSKKAPVKKTKQAQLTGAKYFSEHLFSVH